MTTTVSFKPNGAWSGDSNFTKTGGTGTCHGNWSDNSDASYAKRTSGVGQATVAVGLDVSTAPAGKNLNRWKIRVRNARTGAASKIQAAVYASSYPSGNPQYIVEQTQVKARVFTGVQALGWSESGYYNGSFNPLKTATGVTADRVLFFLSDLCAASADRTTVYETWLELEYVDPPTATVTAPSGTVADTTIPNVTWTFTSTESNAQSRALVRVFDSATYGAAGFDPNTSTPVWDLEVVGSALDLSGAVRRIEGDRPPLANGGSYRAYILVTEDTGFIQSTATSWAYSSFTISLTPPALPSLVAGWDTATCSALVDVQGHTNLLTANQASLETDTTGWAAVTNCSITRSTTQALILTASLRLSSTAGGDMMANTLTGTSGVPVLAGETYTALAYYRAGASARTCRTDIAWYDSGGAFLSASTGFALANNTSGWVTSALSVIAPTNAAYAALRVYVLATGGAAELHYVDSIALHPGVVSTSVNQCTNTTFETNTDGWSGSAFGYTACTLATSASFAVHGTKSMLVTWPTAGTGGSVAYYACTGLTPGVRYTFSGSVRVPSGGSPKVALIDVYGTSTGVVFGTQDTGATTNSFVRLDMSFVATAGIHYIGFANAAAATSGHTCYVDAVQLEIGAAPTTFGVPTGSWSPGGFSPQAILVERSNDGGATWLQVRFGSLDVESNGAVLVDARTERYSIRDYEAARGGTVLYRAREVAQYGTAITTSDYTANFALTTIHDGSAWLKAIDASGLNRSVSLRRGSLDTEIDEDTGLFRPLGRAGEGIVVYGDLYGHDGAMVILTKTPQEYEGVLALLTHQSTLLLQEPLLDSAGHGLQRWIAVTGQRTIRVADNPAIRDLAVTFVDVGPA